jgi:hypothetical protein
MKKYIIILALLTFGLVSLAQNKFTQATFKEMLDDYKRDSKAFFINRLSEDFRYSNPQGKFLHRTDVATGDPQKILTTLQEIDRMLENMLENEVLEPVIFQSCDLAIVSGIQKASLSALPGNEITGEVACTYTFQKRKGKWMLVASQQTEFGRIKTS